jgi:hypothetical protein
MDDDDWQDATFIGSEYEQQVSFSGRWRHRPLTDFRSAYERATSPDSWSPDLPWTDGPAPVKGKTDGA